MHPLLTKVEAKYIKDTFSKIGPGDTIRIFSKVKEGDKERLQKFEGIVLAIRGEGTSKMIKIRKISYGVGVERTFPLHSPNIDSMEVVKYGKPRRAKLFYLRDRVGKRALRVKENTRATQAAKELAKESAKDRTSKKSSRKSKDKVAPAVASPATAPTASPATPPTETKATEKS